MIKIVLVQGSLHQNSSTRAMLNFAEEKLVKLGAQVDWVDLGEVDLPVFNPKTSRDAPGYKQIAPLVDGADAYVLGAPDYHGCPSGAMKNFLDYFWKEFTGKLFGYVCASHEKGLTAMDIMRVAIRQCYGWSLPYGVSGVEKQDIDPEGQITSEYLRDRLTMMAHDLVTYGTIVAAQRGADLKGSDPGFMAAHRS